MASSSRFGGGTSTTRAGACGYVAVGLGGVNKTPISWKSIRPIAMPPMLANEIEELFKEATFRRDDDLVFASERGTPLDGRNMIRSDFGPAKKRAGIQCLRFHDVRHSYASVLIEQGVHPGGDLGTARTRLRRDHDDRYSHLFDRACADVSKELEAAWTARALLAVPVQTDAAAFQTAATFEAERPANAAV